MNVLRRLFLLLCALATLSGVAVAAPVATAAPTCSALKIPNTGHSINLTSFIPDAGCWYVTTIDLLADSGAFDMTLSGAKYLVVILFGIFAVSAYMDKQTRARAIPVTIATIAVYSILTSGAGSQSLTGYIRVMMLNGWPEIYGTSAGYGQTVLAGNGPNSLGTYVKDLAEEMAKMTYNTSVFERVRTQMNTELAAGNFGGDQAAIRARVREIMAADQAKADTEMQQLSLWTTIGSFMVMGLFAVFAALIYSTALGLILTAVMLPISIAFIAVLQWGYLTKAMITFLSALLVTALVSVMTVGVMRIAVGNSATQMTVMLKQSNEQIEASLVKYASDWKQCEWWEGGCNINNVRLEMNVAWEEARSVVVTLGMTLLAASVSVGIATNQLRRVPALISSAIGVSGGGESSGTGANPVRGLAEAAGVTALAKTVQARAAGAAADRLGFGKSSGGQGQPGGKPAGSPGSPPSPGDPKSPAGGAGTAAGPAATAGGPGRPPEAEGAAYGRAHTQGQSQPTTSARIASTLASTPAGRLAAAQHLTAAAGRATGRAAQTVANVTGDRALLDRVGGMASAGAANTQAALTAARSGLGQTAGAARDLAQNAQTQGLPHAVGNAVMSSAPATNVQLGLQARSQRLAEAARQPTAAGQTFAAAAAQVAPTAPGAVPQAPSAAAGATTGPVPSGKGASVPPAAQGAAAPAPSLNSGYPSGPTSRSASPTPTMRSGQFRQAVQIGQEPRPSGLKDFKSGVSANLKPARPSDAPGQPTQPMSVEAARSEATTADLPKEETT